MPPAVPSCAYSVSRSSPRHDRLVETSLKSMAGRVDRQVGALDEEFHPRSPKASARATASWRSGLELGVEPGEVALHGLHADEQLVGDLPVRPPLGQAREDL